MLLCVKNRIGMRCKKLITVIKFMDLNVDSYGRYD